MSRPVSVVELLLNTSRCQISLHRVVYSIRLASFYCLESVDSVQNVLVDSKFYGMLLRQKHSCLFDQTGTVQSADYGNISPGSQGHHQERVREGAYFRALGT